MFPLLSPCAPETNGSFSCEINESESKIPTETAEETWVFPCNCDFPASSFCGGGCNDSAWVTPNRISAVQSEIGWVCDDMIEDLHFLHESS